MHRLRRLTLLPIALLCALLAPAAAQADAASDPSGFHLDSSSLYVNENAGQAVITISRTDTSEDAQIRYITLGDGVQCGSVDCTAVDPIDFSSVKGMLDFPVGVASQTFSVPIVDHGVQSVPKTIEVSLFGPSPIGLAAGFDKSGTASSALAGLGFGSIEIGSISIDPSIGNPKPRLWRLPQDRGIIVHYGLPNDGAVAIAAEFDGSVRLIALDKLRMSPASAVKPEGAGKH